jgi:2-haloacid dehalogenase
MQLTDFKVLTFDCYGTLIDWESGMVSSLQPIASRAPGPPSRDAILEDHGRLEASQQRYTPAKPYREVLTIVARRLAEQWGVDASLDECREYGRSIQDWPAFPDSASALAYLKKHFRLVVLSNVDNESFAASNRRLGVTFDAVYTAEDIGSYKPDPRNFRYMLDQLEGLGVAPSDVLHVAESLFHDHAPANAAGLRSAWIHRRHAVGGYGATRPPADMPHYDFRFESMADLVAAHRAEKNP